MCEALAIEIKLFGWWKRDADGQWQDLRALVHPGLGACELRKHRTGAGVVEAVTDHVLTQMQLVCSYLCPVGIK